MARAKLLDLYKVEMPVVFNTPQGTETVIVRKMSSPQMEKARRFARASQALMMRCKDKHTSTEFLEQLNQVQTLLEGDRARLVEVIVNDEMEAETAYIYARLTIGEDSEWAKDNYITSLIEAWESTYEAIWVMEPDHVEACRYKSEIDRFTDEIDNEVKLHREALEADWSLAETTVLEDKVAEVFLASRSYRQWQETFIRARTFYSTRCADDSSKLYFDNIEDVDELNDDVKARLAEAYDGMAVDPTSGKDLPSALNSSPPPEQAERAATEPSGPVAVSV